MATLKDLNEIGYSRKHGYYIKEFEHKGENYLAKLIPYPIKDSRCVIRLVTNKEDIDNVTASDDAQVVYRKGSMPFKPESLRECIKEFLKNV